MITIINGNQIINELENQIVGQLEIVGNEWQSNFAMCEESHFRSLNKINVNDEQNDDL